MTPKTIPDAYQRAPQMLPSSPLTFRIASRVLPRCRLGKQKKSTNHQKIEDDIIVNLGPKWGAKWVHKFKIMWIMPSMNGEHYRSRQHASKIMHHGDTQTLKNLILVSTLERKRSCHFSTFIGNVINLLPKWAWDWCAWTLWDEKVSKNEVKIHYIKR
jgi:hypothetical protein